MEDKSFVFKKFDSMTVELISQQDVNFKVIPGRALVNESDSRLIFLQNQKRQIRSKEIARRNHCRLVLRPDGRYTLTFRFRLKEKFLLEELISELRSVIKYAQSN